MSDGVRRAGESEIFITLLSLRAVNDGAAVAIKLLLENGEQREERQLTVSTEQYCELKPRRGRITAELYEQLEAAAQLSAAVQSGARLLAYGANTEDFLTKKLMRRGYSRAVAAEAASSLKAKGLIDEDQILIREVEKCLRKLWGAGRIRAHLYSRGFDSASISRLEELLADVDLVGACFALIGKHYARLPDEGDERRRLIAFLSRYGYSLTEIRSAFARMQS